MPSVQGHSGPVTSLAALRLSDGGTLLASTAAEENVLIWECPPGISSAATPDDDAANSPSQPLPCSSTGALHSKEAGSKPQPASGPHKSRDSGRWSNWRLTQHIPWGVQLQHSAALTQLPGRPDWCDIRCASYGLLCRHLPPACTVAGCELACDLYMGLNPEECALQGLAGIGKCGQQRVAPLETAKWNICSRLPAEGPWRLDPLPGLHSHSRWLDCVSHSHTPEMLSHSLSALLRCHASAAVNKGCPW